MANKSGNPFDFDISKFVGEFKIPGLDVEAAVAAQRKNIEALTTANKLAMDSMQATYRRQVELMQEVLKEAQAAAADLGASGPLPEKAAKQTELVKDAFERCTTHSREISEMLARSNKEIADLMQARFNETLNEVKAAFEKASKGGK